jgi:integrase
LVPNPKLKLFDQCREVMRFQHLAFRTEQAYLGWIKRYVVFCRESLGSAGASPCQPKGWRHPRDCGRQEIRVFLTHLAAERRVAAATQKQALNAVVYLYREVLGMDLGDFSDFRRAEPKQRVPVVLSREECGRLLDRMEPPLQWAAQLMYGSGLRLMECLRLRVKDLEFSRGEILVRDGKGQKDRVTMLPRNLIDPLRTHLAKVRQ